MAQVSVRVNGYSYILGCADGQEDHLRSLAADIDRRIDGIKVAAGPSGESRLLLMAALVLSDELYELRALSGYAQPLPPPEAARPEPKAARRLTRLARRAEAIADMAEQADRREKTADEARMAGEETPPERQYGDEDAPDEAVADHHETAGETGAPGVSPGASPGASPGDTHTENIAARPEHP